MAKFFEGLINKFFDFFNMGRFITIIIPGLIAAICFSMLASQIICPVQPTITIVNVDIDNKNVTSELTSDKKTCKTETVTKKTNYKYEKSIVQENSDQKTLDPGDVFKKQVSEDYHRIYNNYLVLFLLTIVFGLIIYEIGFGILSRFKVEKEYILYRYNSSHDSEKETVKKFNFLIAEKESEKKDENNEVGLVYFAPFLKEKFSGEENYFNFLIMEYYRFLEFSVIMPVTVIISEIICAAYYAVFCYRHSFIYCRGFAVLFVVLFVLSFGFLLLVTPCIFESYKKASRDLINGVTDFMKKGLAGKN